MKGKNGVKKRSLHAILQVEFFIIFAVIALGMLVFHALEGRRWLDAFYFVVITISGVGYGDITPHTDSGKIVAALLASVALPLYVFTTSILITKGMELFKKKEGAGRTQRIITYYSLLIINPYNEMLVVASKHEDGGARNFPSMPLSYGTDPENYCLETLRKYVGIHEEPSKRFGVRSFVDMKAALHHVYNIYHVTIRGENETVFPRDKEHLTKTYQRISLNDIRNDRDEQLSDEMCKWLKDNKMQLQTICVSYV